MIPDKIDRGVTSICKVVGLILLGWFASSAYHATGSIPFLHQQAAAVPSLIAEKKAADCTVKKVTQVAKQAIVSANSESVPTPDPSALKPCPLPKK